MTFIEKLELMERVDNLIRRKGTGSATDLSKRLNISRRNVYNLIEQMKTLGAPIDYCKNSRTFFYQYPVKYCFRFSAEVNTSKIFGGAALGYFRSHKLSIWNTEHIFNLHHS